MGKAVDVRSRQPRGLLQRLACSLPSSAGHIYDSRPFMGESCMAALTDLKEAYVC
jgi:hypothetical protein